MQICLEGPRGDWGWFDFDIKEPNLGLDLEKVKAVTGTINPVVIDTEYDDSGLDDILSYDGMGYTPVSSLFKQAELLQDLDDYDLERVAIYMRTKGGDLEYAVDHYDNHAYVETNDSDPASLAHEWVDISGGISKEVAERYFDYYQLGQDLLMDDYETDSDDPYEVGEDYIDMVYGGLDLYLAEIAEDPRNDNYYNDYFDWDAYGRDLSFSNTYDEQSGVWISESKNKNVRTSKLSESVDLTQRFRDWRGIFGEPGNVVTGQELKDYWRKEHEWDPVLQDFDSFEDWYYATIEWFEPLYGHTESIDLTQQFQDPQGMFGEPGSIVTAQELKDYWDEEHEWDPSLQEFDNFEDWYKETVEWLKPINESYKPKLHIKESEGSIKYTGRTWKDFINNIEANSYYVVDSSDRNMLGSRHDTVLLLKPGSDTTYIGEVTRYHDGWYELMDYNIHPQRMQYSKLQRNRKRHIKESAIKNNIENIMYNASLVHSYDDLDVVLSSLYKLDKELYNKYQNIYRTQKIRPKQLADMIYDELSNILGQND